MFAGRAAVGAAQKRRQQQEEEERQRKKKSPDEFAELEELEEADFEAVLPEGLNSDNYSNPFILQYLKFARWCYEIVLNDVFNLFIIGVIVAAGIVVGLLCTPILSLIQLLLQLTLSSSYFCLELC